MLINRTAFLIARHEARRLLRDPFFLAAACFLMLLLCGALLESWYRQASEIEARTASQTQSRAKWDAHDRMNPHAAAHYGIWIYKPPTPLAILDPGVEPYVGVSSHLVAHREAISSGVAIRQANRYFRWAELSAFGIAWLLLPLLTLLVTAGTLVDDRATGVMRQVLAEGVSRGTFALGKYLGILGALLMLLVPCLAVSSALALYRWDSSLLAIALWGGAATLYLMVFAGVGVTVSALSPNRSTALVVLLAFYALTVFVIPRWSAVEADRRVAVDNNAALKEQVRLERENYQRQHGTFAEIHQRVVDGLLRQYKVAKVEDLPVNPEGFLLEEGEKIQSEINDAVYSKVTRAHDAQDRIVASSDGLYWPSTAFWSLSSALAQTDGHAQRRYLQSVEAYRRDWLSRLNRHYAMSSRPGESVLASRALFQGIPPFQPVAESVDAVIERNKQSLAVLLAWATASLTLGFVAVRMMRPESA